MDQSNDYPIEKSTSLGNLNNMNHLTLISNQSGSSPNLIDRTARIILIGDSGVGKSCIILRYLQNTFKEKLPCTAGVELAMKILNIEGDEIRLQIWDTAGQERYRNVTKSFFKQAVGIFLVFDLTHRESFNNLGEWCHLIEENAPEDTVITVLGNKNDLKKERVIKNEEINEFILIRNMNYYEVSAKNNTNIDEAFLELAKRIKKKKFDRKSNENEYSKSVRLSSSVVPGSPELKLKKREEAKKSCC